jgi:hypothetical protein
MADEVERRTPSERAAWQLANPTKTHAQWGGITPRWLVNFLTWTPVEAGIFRLNRAKEEGDSAADVELRQSLRTSIAQTVHMAALFAVDQRERHREPFRRQIRGGVAWRPRAERSVQGSHRPTTSALRLRSPSSLRHLSRASSNPASCSVFLKAKRTSYHEWRRRAESVEGSHISAPESSSGDREEGKPWGTPRGLPAAAGKSSSGISLATDGAVNS